MTQTAPRSESDPGLDDAGMRVRLLDVEPELAAGINGSDLDALRASLMMPAFALRAGTSPPAALNPGAIAALVVRGLLVCERETFARPAAEVFGPGDLLDPAQIRARDSEWRALTDAHVLVLDERYVQAARRYPQLLRGLVARTLQSCDELQLRASIVGMPRVEDRLLAMLASFATRWGHVTPQGLTLDLPVTHQLLGRLVGARRPTISLAVGTLRDQGLLRRDGHGPWILPPTATEWSVDGVPDGRVAPVAALRLSS
jgi:CRP/FNR family transcriptional regulator, cyclic AMP receptor protein